MNIDQIKKISKTKYLHSLARLNLKEKYLSELLVTIDGGTFSVTPQLIAFLSSTSDDSVILIDIYENICKTDRITLLTLCHERYNTVMNKWYLDNESINKQR